MNILLATSEAVPFAKTGGMADVCGALPVELARAGHHAALILPAYKPASERAGPPIEPTGVDFEVTIGSKQVGGRFLRSTLPNSRVPVYLVENDTYFARPELYQEQGKDYKDNCERFVFFCRAVLEAVRLLDLRPDVVHCHDWQTGLVPAYLKLENRGVPAYENVGSLFTIHNMAYQGVFWHWDMLLTGLDWKYFNWHQMEFYGSLNLLKTGLVFADRLNTVSPTYAQEIQTTPNGCGLEGVLQQRRGALSGIVNGVDYAQWNPATDPHLPLRYGPANVAEGKAACKAALQEEVGLPRRAGTPLVALVGRLSEQKGIDLVASVLRDWLRTRDEQWIVLGTGDPAYHDVLRALAARHPDKLVVRLEFSEPLAHRIEAAADVFLMPSKFEPCGLSQLYSLKYGTVPVVRATGGLVDTIVDATEATLADGTATGFAFREYNALALGAALDRAMTAFANRDTWGKIVATGMRQDWSWAKSAEQYVRLYEQICSGAGKSRLLAGTAS